LFAFTEAEWQTIKDAADSEGMAAAAWGRRVLLQVADRAGKPLDEVAGSALADALLTQETDRIRGHLDGVLRELRLAGTALNDITTRVNGGQIPRSGQVDAAASAVGNWVARIGPVLAQVEPVVAALAGRGVGNNVLATAVARLQRRVVGLRRELAASVNNLSQLTVAIDGGRLPSSPSVGEVRYVAGEWVGTLTPLADRLDEIASNLTVRVA
jgi:hypothetical protein